MQNKLTFILLLLCSCAFGQLDEYNYKRELLGVSETWHKVVLPNELFGKVESDLSDIRIFGITADNDTVEAPYILQLKTEQVSNNDVNFRTVNTSYNSNGYYFTLEVPTEETINQINLNFGRKNFDWRLKLEGSHNQKEWFTLVEDYRILSITNSWTDYQFTKVKFPISNHHYYRIQINSSEKPEFRSANVSKYEVIDGNFRAYTIASTSSEEEKDGQATILEIDLGAPVPISFLKINVLDTFDYYRPFTVKYLSDSFKTEQGWKYRYTALTSGVLNSIEGNEFKIRSTTARKLKITINNHDNEPLDIAGFEVKGYVHELVTRITKPATYFLVYGNSEVRAPSYDINRFQENIPSVLEELMMGEERIIDKDVEPGKKPLFENMAALWIVMGCIILLLGWFSLKMMKKN